MTAPTCDLCGFQIKNCVCVELLLSPPLRYRKVEARTRNEDGTRKTGRELYPLTWAWEASLVFPRTTLPSGILVGMVVDNAGALHVQALFPDRFKREDVNNATTAINQWGEVVKRIQGKELDPPPVQIHPSDPHTHTLRLLRWIRDENPDMSVPEIQLRVDEILDTFANSLVAAERNEESQDTVGLHVFANLLSKDPANVMSEIRREVAAEEMERTRSLNPDSGERHRARRWTKEWRIRYLLDKIKDLRGE